MTDEQGDLIGRPCWLVIVPRGDLEVDGLPRTGTSASRLVSSPLSESNWANRIVVPLEFEPAGEACPIGSAERPVRGHPSAFEAVSRWQPALCAGGGQSFSFGDESDIGGRAKLASGDPGLVIVSRPLPPGEFPDDPQPVYAPVAISGLTIAYNVESQGHFSLGADDPIRQRDGQRITELRLNARLVAKLLTQSYQKAVSIDGAAHLDGNPMDLTSDPEFLSLNGMEKQPFERQFFAFPVTHALVATESADAVEALWTWVLGDRHARAFLEGKPDPDNKDTVKVNPKNRLDQLPQPLDWFAAQDNTLLRAAPQLRRGLARPACVVRG